LDVSTDDKWSARACTEEAMGIRVADSESVAMSEKPESFKKSTGHGTGSWYYSSSRIRKGRRDFVARARFGA
jgi:hypothetical protein